MKTIWRDSLSTLLVIFGAIVMFAKLRSYSWWLIGSWKGALGVLAVTGLAILATNAVELWKMVDGMTFAELGAWLIAGTVTIASLVITTTRAAFIWSGVLIGLAWLFQAGSHLWRGTHSHGQHYFPAS